MIRQLNKVLQLMKYNKSGKEPKDERVNFKVWL